MHAFSNGKFYVDIPDGCEERFHRGMEIRNYMRDHYALGISQQWANIDRRLIEGKCVFSIDPEHIVNTEVLLDYVKDGGNFVPPRCKL